MSAPPAAPSPPPARSEPRREISRGWFVIIGVVWLAVIVASAVWGLAHPDATDREQTTVAEAKPVVDEAIARIADAVTVGGTAVVAVSGFERVGPCDVSIVRGGERYRRSLVAIVRPGTELDALDRVAAALPASYRPSVRRGTEPRLTADAGFWVLVSGTVTGPGEIEFIADTGDCRPLGLDISDDSEPTSTEWASSTLARLRLTAPSGTSARVSCMHGGVLVTSEARAGPYEGDLTAALRDGTDSMVIVVNEPRLFAYRTAGTQVAVRAHEGATILTVTEVCE